MVEQLSAEVIFIVCNMAQFSGYQELYGLSVTGNSELSCCFRK